MLLCLAFHPGLFIRGITEIEVIAGIRCDAGVGMYVLLCSKTFPDGSLKAYSTHTHIQSPHSTRHISLRAPTAFNHVGHEAAQLL